MATALLSGGTGAVGSTLAHSLRKAGYDLLFLTREKGGQIPRERLGRILGGSGDANRILTGDVTLPLAGLSEADIARWRGKISSVVHCAASISFEKSDHSVATEVNVSGTRNMLELASTLCVPHFHHISTAYVAGGNDELFEEDLFNGQAFRNVYEESKAEGERQVRQWQDGQWTIYRLSICVGDMESGYTPSFTGYYGFFKAVHHLKKYLSQQPADMLRRIAAEGVTTENGRWNMPIHFRVSSESTLNLIASDWMARTMVAAMGKPAPGRTFHVVNDSPPRVQDVVERSMNALMVDGYRFEWRDGVYQEGKRRFLDGIQGMLEERIDRFLPYVTHEARFDTASVRAHLGEKYRAHPPITDAVYAKLLEFAVRCDFKNTGRARNGN